MGTKRKIAGWIMLPVVCAALFGILAIVVEAFEEQKSPAPSASAPSSLPIYWDEELQEMVRWREGAVDLEAMPGELEDDERLTSLCEGYAHAAARVIRSWYEEPEPAKEPSSYHAPAVGGPNAHFFYAILPASPLLYAPRVEARCSWRELNLALEFPDFDEYYDPQRTLESILDDLKRDEGMDAYSDRMKIVVEDADTGLYAAFEPGGRSPADGD